MRSKSGWSALLLAVAVALAPTGAWAQSWECVDANGLLVRMQPPPTVVRGQMGVDYSNDPEIPLPVGHPRMSSVGGFYTALEFEMWRMTNPIRRQLIAVRGFVDVDGSVTGDLNGTVVFTDTTQPFIIRGPIVPGNFLGTGTPALFTDDLRGQETFQPGYKITVGYRFDSGVALEGSFFSLIRASYSANASLIPPGYANLAAGPFLADTFLFAPFVNLPPEFGGSILTQEKMALGNPGAVYGIFNGAVNMAISFEQFYQQWDVRVRTPLFQDDCTRCYSFCGGRISWFWEQFKLRSVAAGFDGASAPEDVGVYSNIVSNRMYGPVIGVGAERYIGKGFGIGLELETAFLLDIAKERAYLQNGDRSSELRQTPFVRLKKAATEFTPVGEFGANAQIHWYPIEGVQLRAGYNFMGFLNTIAAEEPIAFDARSFDPNWSNRPLRWLDGFNAGIGFIF